MDCHGDTHIGLVRDTNEDQFLIADLRKSVVIHHTSLDYAEETELSGASQAKLLMVADGMGGHAAGERASWLAVEGTTRYLLNAMHWLYAMDQESADESFRSDLKHAFEYSRNLLRDAAESNPEQAGMGTTVTMAYVVWPRVYIAHVGDTRAYLLRESRLELLTHDQSLAQELADAGVIEASQIDTHPFSHMLWSVMGCSDTRMNPVVFRAELALNDQLLLCSDGLTRGVDDAQILQILNAAANSGEACRNLIDAANDAGGKDNTTVVVARFTENRTPVETAAHEEVQPVV